MTLSSIDFSRAFDKEGQGLVLNVNKPLGWTSFDVVKKIRNGTLNGTKVGHAGTLDPLATGVLIVCIGKATKTIDSLMATRKEYTGIIQLGQTTASFDLETTPEGNYPTEHISQDLVNKAAESFIGDIMQVPPVFSAISVNGERAYTKAREGVALEMEPRKITIDSLDLTLLEGNKIEFRTVCSKGTYIRSLANDIGKALSSGAYLAKLERSAVGEYRVENSLEVEAVYQELKQHKTKFLEIKT